MDNKKRILIVEDESIIAMDIRKVIQDLGYEVSAMVSTGAAAIHEAQKNHLDLVLMDILLRGPFMSKILLVDNEKMSCWCSRED